MRKKEKQFLCIIMACVLAILNSNVSLAQVDSEKSVEMQKEALINTILTSEDSKAVEQANEALNKIIEEEVKQNTLNSVNTGESANTIQPKAGVQIRNYQSTTVSNYKDRKGQFKGTYARGETETIEVTVTVNAGTQFQINNGTTISLGAAATASKSWSISGPADGVCLRGSNLSATHRAAIAILRGTIVHETFDYYDGSTGEFISHVDRYLIGNPTVTKYNLLVADSSSDFYVEHCTDAKYKRYSNIHAFKNVINSTNPTPAYDW